MSSTRLCLGAIPSARSECLQYDRADKATSEAQEIPPCEGITDFHDLFSFQFFQGTSPLLMIAQRYFFVKDFLYSFLTKDPNRGIL